MESNLQRVCIKFSFKKHDSHSLIWLNIHQIGVQRFDRTVNYAWMVQFIRPPVGLETPPTYQHHQLNFSYGRRWDSNLKYFFVWALIKNVYQQWKCPWNFRSCPPCVPVCTICFPASRIAVSARIKTNNYKSHVIPNDIENEWPLGAILNRREEGRVPYQWNHYLNREP